MNENINICVKTLVGMTEEANTGMGVAQGSVDGAVNSAVALANLVAEEFSDMGDTNYNVKHILAKFFDPMDVFHPIVFQDNLGKVSPDIKSA